MKRCWILVLFVLNASLTQTFRLLESDADLVQEIDNATKLLLITSNQFTNQSVAEAVLHAMTERSVEVYILALSDGVAAPEGYFVSLYLAGARLRHVQTPVEASLIVIDNKAVIQGERIATERTAEETTIVYDDQSATQYAFAFRETFEAATPYHHPLEGD
jgi:hypothetical protein